MKTYSVWFAPKNNPDAEQLFIISVPLGVAQRIADTLVEEGFVREAWIEED